MKDVQKIKEFFLKDRAMTSLYEETAVDMAKKKLDALGVKYEMSTTDKVRPFKAIYKPINKSDEFYDKFNNIVDLFNLKGVVKTSMSKAQSLTGGYPHKKTSGAGFEKIEITEPMDDATKNRMIKNFEIAGWDAKPNNGGGITAVKKSMNEAEDSIKVGDIIGNTVQGFNFKVKEIKNNSYIVQNTKTGETIETYKDNMYKSGTKMYEAKKEDAVDTITMDIPLFLRMLEYSREDASQDMDLHDVTEKANTLGKERGILSMEDYDEIVGAAKEIDEAELTEAYVPSNIKEFAKRKGVSSLVNKVAGWAERVGKGIRGGTAIGKNYDTLILDMGYQTADIYINTEDETIELYGEPVRSFNEFERVYNENKEDNGLEERIAEALNKINEELCPAGKAYIKRRQAAGEKSSAYLSGRAVKVCKGQMSGTAKKKK